MALPQLAATSLKPASQKRIPTAAISSTTGPAHRTSEGGVLSNAVHRHATYHETLLASSDRCSWLSVTGLASSSRWTFATWPTIRPMYHISADAPHPGDSAS